MIHFVPLTKIILTLIVAVLAIFLKTPHALLTLCGVELLILLVSNELFSNIKSIFMLCLFAAFLGIVEILGGGTNAQGLEAAIRMMAMTLIFIYLLTTVRLQDLTATMVSQLKIPTEYAFMFTAGLRFIPDFLEENTAVTEAQACRGLAIEGNIFKKLKRYMSVVKPLVLRALDKSETMALALELRSFGTTKKVKATHVSLKKKDCIFLFIIMFVTGGVVYGQCLLTI
ncbi:MAG: energy-coupling factor transporter transmembrane component T [Dialister micraerophilus]|uniref:energy-coupling factor transporter transmembrane component T family protein n=1 Tax=Dialister micraerophilus TaxID=309120 RepID=UPI0023F4FE78|nr:energy-coupling factor transporter transmembrane component T [Dialister micraerophilus]MDK8285618.1 energy-coupling factor transporter transmembrane component T [Dialister micraerophilus]MDU5301156.1 energy-coupling factor transporter transmembrane component T [Dialister micraerophilus]